MFNLKKFVWFISAFALFSFVVAGQHAEAGPYKGVRLLLDGYAPAEDDSMMAMMFGDRVNNNVTSVVPPAAGDTVDIEIYVSDAPAPWRASRFRLTIRTVCFQPTLHRYAVELTLMPA